MDSLLQTDMKTADEILSFIYNSDKEPDFDREELQMCITLNPQLKYIEESIESAQKEAWNEAIKAAAESAKADWSGMATVWVDKDSILKLLK